MAADYATARTEEVGEEQYRYAVAVDWAALDALAERIGLDPITRILDNHPA